MKKRVMIFSIIIIIIIIIISPLFIFGVLRYKTGVVTKVTATAQSDEKLNLKISYLLPMGGYSVHEVSQDEGEYVGDGKVDYDGSLGKYRIMVNFGDVAPHKSIVKNTDENGIFEITSSTVSLKAKIARPSDHGFVLYIGSDRPIHVEEIENEKFNLLYGSIKIPIILGDAE